MTIREGSAGIYKKRHDEIWPELAQLLHAYGIFDYGIFLDESTRELFAVLKISDAAHLDRLADEPLMRRWWQYMSDIMECNGDQSPATVPLKEMFYMP